MSKNNLIFFITVLLYLVGCTGNKLDKRADESGGKLIPVEYAGLFTITDYKDYTAVTDMSLMTL